MSRVINLAMTEAQVVHHCREKGIAISALEALPDGGVRVVCMSAYGAAQVRLNLKGYVVTGEVRRKRFRPIQPLW